MPTLRPVFGALAALTATPALAQEPTRGEWQTAIALGYTADAFQLLRGGDDPGASLLHKADLSAELTRDTQAGEIQVFGALQYTGGNALSGQRVGDAQGVSNIEAPDALRLSEAWVSYEHGDGEAGVRAGLIDLNRDFDTQETGSLFLHGSHGVGAELGLSGAGGPSIFPNTGFGVAAHRSTEAWTVRGGVYEGLPRNGDEDGRGRLAITSGEGALVIGEAELRPREGMTLRAGSWRYASRRDHEDNGPDDGAYVLAEHDSGDTAGWVRAAYAVGGHEAVQTYLGGGVVRRGLFRDHDAIGLAVAHARFSPPADAGPRPAPETAVELTYQFPVETLSLQPTIAYVANPGGREDVPDALLVGVRVALALDLQ